ncbi:MAG: protein kinase [Candidatus Aminicenantes bacterium]|nr:protein kinase [Candidatus Aminicenantes bacterium]
MKKILIVEDDKALLETFKSFLETENFNVLPSCDGEVGFRLACQEKVDLILLDFTLPSLSGLEICKKLREKGIMTPIIMLTGEKKKEIDKVLGLELGADDYLIKPLGTKELLARIKAVLRRTKAEAAEVEESYYKTQTLQTPISRLTRGTTIGGRYEVIEQLGKGGMGKVYRVLDNKVGEEVALKLLNPEIAADEKIIERFRNELKFARKISQRNVCRMYDLNEDEGTQFITMEYVPGEDLKSTIRRMGQLSVGKAISIAKQVCEGLSEAHEFGVVHRDLKPQNIMIDKKGNVRIMDFGIARSLEVKGITGTGMMIGTPEYMSPEQAQGKDIDLRSDIYSLGIILYEMVTGKVPFEGDTPLSIVLKHQAEKPRNPKEVNDQIPEDLSRVILNCMEKDKEKRYQLAEEVLSELKKIEKGIPTTEMILPKRKTEVDKIAEIKWENSIAVLPLADLSQKKDQEYFCDGMAEDIITKLTRIEELKVISRTSVMRYKKVDKDIKEIGKELGVRSILEGSIRKEKDHIRVSAELINVEDGFHLWADAYDRKLESVFEVQDDVSKAIADALKLKLSPETIESLKTGRPKNIDAYEYNLKGMHYINSKYIISHREEDFKAAIKMFKKAIEIDPNYALAYGGLGWAYQHHYQITGKKKDIKLVLKNCEICYELNPTLVETNTAVAWSYFLRGEYDKAFQSLKRALEINPNISTLNHVTGLFFRQLGLLYQAVEYFSRALEFDPFFLPSHSLRARCLIYTGELEKAAFYIEKASEIEPDNFWSLLDNSLLLVIKKEYNKAEKLLARAEKINPDYSTIQFYRALLFAARGEKNKALTLRKNGPVYALLGMKDDAIKYIDNKIKKGTEHFQYSYLPLANNAFYESLRDNARFEGIVKKQKKKYEERLKKYGEL